MLAEIISNGDEITSGKIVDTNSQLLSAELLELGIRTGYHTTVGDDRDAMLDVLRIAASRVDLIIWTGGLGPTADDLTRQVIAEFANVPLVLNEDSLKYIKSLFAKRGYEMPESNKIQALQPKNATPIHNPQGTAPGIDIIVKKQNNTQTQTDHKTNKTKTEPQINDFKNHVRIMAFPGVPAELKEMWNLSAKNSINNMILKFAGQKNVIRTHSIHCFGRGETAIEEMLPDIINRNHTPRVGITASQGTITLRILAEADNEENCRKQITTIANLIHEKLGELIYGENDDRLQDIICRQLNRAKKSVAVIETGTRGKLTQAITDSKESQNCFKGGIILAPNETQSANNEIESYQNLFKTDYIISIGNYTKENTPPKKQITKITILEKDQNNNLNIKTQEDFNFAGHSDIKDDMHVKFTLNLFRKFLQ
ncbi:MAG: damage-inducible protein CinA [Planctomycetaceae bacterium]|jgi:nicotinamide-nucleotide amidase|nr:damage-inducible protein CinA [Planctomycetaceae bacterium]